MSARKRREQRDTGFFSQPATPISEADAALFSDISKADALSPSAEEAIVNRGEGIVGIGKFNVSTIGLTMTDEVTKDEWMAFFKAIRRITNSIQWIIGDLAAYGKEKFNLDYEDIAGISGYRRKTVEEYASISRNVPITIRRETLSFGHHQLVAPMPEHEQISWLAYAEENELSVAKLREAMNTTPSRPDKDPLGAKRFKQRASAVSRVINKLADGVQLNQREAELLLGDLEQMRQWLAEAEQHIIDNTQAE